MSFGGVGARAMGRGEKEEQAETKVEVSGASMRMLVGSSGLERSRGLGKRGERANSIGGKKARRRASEFLACDRIKIGNLLGVEGLEDGRAPGGLLRDMCTTVDFRGCCREGTREEDFGGRAQKAGVLVAVVGESETSGS
jgi:hypothetical protein